MSKEMEEMPTSSKIQKLRIGNKLRRVTSQQLKEIEEFMNSLLAETCGDKKRVIHLKGIWKTSGLEKIADPEKEVKKIRADLADQILRYPLISSDITFGSVREIRTVWR